MTELSTLEDAGDLRGERVLLRLDLNLPIKNGIVADTYRLDRASKTLEFLERSGARTIIIGHLESKETASLASVREVLARRFQVFFATTLAEAREKQEAQPEGSFVLLENLRAFDGEKTNLDEFSKKLASLGEVYVNEAFSVSHRAHASIVGVPRFLPSFAGFLFEEEVKNLSKSFSPAHPALLILGGAKFETKLPLVERLLSTVDDVYLCGALANGIYKARGYETGVSLVSETTLPTAIIENPKLHTPSDVTVRTASGRQEKRANTVLKDEKIVDVGQGAITDLRALIARAKFVLWNGPLGEYEAGFDAGTIAVARALAESHATTIIGGGDSLAIVSKLGLTERFSFVSTGGGAMLDFLAKGTLPGIEALRESAERITKTV